MPRAPKSPLGLAALASGAVAASVLVGSLAWMGCSTSTVKLFGGSNESNSAAAAEAEGPCPARLPAPERLPGISDQHRSASYWIERARAVGDPDAVLLDADEIARHNAAFEAKGGKPLLTHVDLTREPPRSALLEELNERLGYMRGKIDDGSYVDAKGKRRSTPAPRRRSRPSTPCPSRAPKCGWRWPTCRCAARRAARRSTRGPRSTRPSTATPAAWYVPRSRCGCSLRGRWPAKSRCCWCAPATRWAGSTVPVRCRRRSTKSRRASSLAARACGCWLRRWSTWAAPP